MINVAIEKAKQMTYIPNQVRIYAIAVDSKGKVVSEGQNSYVKTHPIQARFAKLVGLHEKCYLHSEVDAIIKARGKEISKLYIARVDSKGKPKLAAPCPICNKAIKHYGIKSVEYTV